MFHTTFRVFKNLFYVLFIVELAIFDLKYLYKHIMFIDLPEETLLQRLCMDLDHSKAG
jgi:hypothetical protein